MHKNGDLLAGLPRNTLCQIFTNFRNLQAAAQHTLHNLEDQNENASQYLVILCLPPHASAILLDDSQALGDIPFRFTLEGNMDLIKVIPSTIHGCSTDNFREEIGHFTRTTGVPRSEYQWGMSTTIFCPDADVTKAKQPDQCFWPGVKPVSPGSDWLDSWPTLVIETGVCGSVDRLREDAMWWFHDSRGDTRAVLLLVVEKEMRMIRVEKWQILPCEGSTTVMVSDVGEGRIAYLGKELHITPYSAVGAPLVLPFEEVMRRLPVKNEKDIVLSEVVLMGCAKNL